MNPIRRYPRARTPSPYTAAYQRERRRRALGWVLVAAGVAMAFVHAVAHLGRLHIVVHQDLLLGYPMAAVLTLAGAVLIGRAVGTGRP